MYKIATLPTCKTCDLVKEYLDRNGLSYKEYDADMIQSGHTREVDLLAELSIGQGSVPVVMLDGKLVDHTLWL